MPKRARRYVPQSLWVLGWFCLVAAALHWHNPHFWQTAHEGYRKAQAARAAGNLDAAAALMKNVLTQEGDNLGYLLFDAYLKCDLGQLPQAKKRFAQALALVPNHGEALLGMAALHAQAGNCAAAVDNLNRLAVARTDSQARRRMAGIYAQCGDFKAALAILKLLWETPPTEIADLEQLLDMAAAAQDWITIRDLPIDPLLASEDPAVRINAIDTRALALQQLGDAAEAYALYLQAPHAGNLLARAQLAQKLGRYADAAALWSQLLAQDPDRLAWRRAEAFSLLRAGRSTAAEERYRGLLADKVASNGDRVQLAWLLNTEGRYTEAWSILAPLPQPHRSLPILEIQARTAFWAGDMVAAVPLIRALLSRKAEG
ncbi:MAG: hypothetical protein QNJ22_14225 [Desulfosarcinaceae bacterium]|nr:hypothetical protein [Desulfosarcinaceae bacterium]